MKSSETNKYAETDYYVEVVVGKAQQILSGTSNYNKKTGDTEFKLDTRIDEGDGHLSYVSDNENLVTVSESGQISIYGVGTATVTVTTSETDNYLASSIKVTIVVSKGTSEQESTTPSETEEITTLKSTEQPTSSKPTEKPTTQKVETTQNNNKVKKPFSTKIKSVKKAKKSLKITWKKVKGITGYQIQYSTSSKFKKAKKITIKKANTVSKTIKKLKAKKKYYIRIRSYVVVNGTKKYSNWSKKKS